MSFESWTQLDNWNWEHVHGASPWMFSFEFWHITSNCACRKGQVILWNQVSKYLAAFFFWNWFFNILQPCSTIIPWIPWSVLLESLHQATGRRHGELLWRFAGGWWLLLGVDHRATRGPTWTPAHRRRWISMLMFTQTHISPWFWIFRMVAALFQQVFAKYEHFSYCNPLVGWNYQLL